MEITDAETTVLRRPIGREVGDSRLSITDVYWIVVEIETDAGYTGTGWMGSLGFAPGVMRSLTAAQFLEPLLGRDPFETEAIQADLRTRSIYIGELGLAAWPRGAIDVALWDIKAKAAGEPLFRFLGGEDRSVDLYLSKMDATVDRAELPALYREYRDQFAAFKTKVGDQDIETERERLETIRETIGPEPALFADANQAWDVAEAVRHVRALDAFDLGWIEEPISEFDEAGHERVADGIPTRLATGEMFYRPERFRRLLEAGAVDVVQPDLVRSGGVTGAMDVARLASHYAVPVATHFYYAISAHLVSAAPTGWMAEYIPEYDIAPLLADPPSIEDGAIVLPERPGHGYAIDPDARAEYEVPPEVLDP